jgi:hypothetical protein
MSLDWLPGLDLSTGTFTLPLWAAGLAVALFVALLVIAVLRSGMAEFGNLAFRAAVILIAVAFGWTYVSRTGEQDRLAERRALDSRATELVTRAIAPGSAVACLEATNTETVEGSCERAVFASPETVAAATAYIGARISLLADAHEYVKRDQGYETQISGLRRTVAADRYGLSSQVLSVRDGCTADACDAFGLVYDDKKLKANLRDRLFDVTVGRYAVNWPLRTRSTSSSQPGATSSGASVSFPSMQSMPPVNNTTTSAAEPATPPSASPFSAPTQDTAAPPTNTSPASATKRAPAAAPKAAQKSAAPSAPAPLSLNPTTKQ